MSEFKAFLVEMKIFSLATAFIVGVASNDLVKSLVNNILMLIPSGTWEEASFQLGSAEILWGPFLSTLVHFVIVLFIIFIITKKLMKAEKEKS